MIIMRILIQVHILCLKIVKYDLVYCFVFMFCLVSHTCKSSSWKFKSFGLGHFFITLRFLHILWHMLFIYFKKSWNRPVFSNLKMPFFIPYDQNCPDNQNRRNLRVYPCFYKVLVEFNAVWAASYLHNSRREIKLCSCVSYNMKQSIMSK